MHSLAFITRICHDARSSECQINVSCLDGIFKTFRYPQYPESSYCIWQLGKRHAVEKRLQVLWCFHYLRKLRLWILS